MARGLVFSGRTIHSNPSSSKACSLSTKPSNSNKEKEKKRQRAEPVQLESTRIEPLERLVERDWFVKFLTKSKHLLSNQPHHSLPLHHRVFNLHPDNAYHCITRHPLLFETFRRRHKDGDTWFRFTDLMEQLLREELQLSDSMFLHRVTALRKLLMISAQKRIPLKKILHCRSLFGIPDDFRDRIANYPNCFRIVEDGGEEVVELVDWDSTLAVTALERESMVLPLVSPYSDGSKLDACSLEAEKYRLGMVHEFLSLTIEKRAYVHHIVELKEELSLSKTVYKMLLKQPGIFYVGGTVKNWVVFLKDAYDVNGVLIKKDPQVVFNEKLYSCAAQNFSCPMVGESD